MKIILIKENTDNNYHKATSRKNSSTITEILVMTDIITKKEVLKQEQIQR